MHRNQCTKHIKLLKPDEAVPLLNGRIAKDIVDPAAFDCYLINEAFCAKHKDFSATPSPNQNQVNQGQGYYFNQTNLIIPKYIYRINNLVDGNRVGGLLSPHEDVDSVKIPLIVEGRVENISDQKASFFSVDHHCADSNLMIGGRTGGGVCGRKVGSPYVGELWFWEQQYPGFETDPMRQLVHHYLKSKFKLENPIRLVQLLLPDYNIVRIPVLSADRDAEERHEKLMSATADTVFGIDDLTLVDGPDIFIGTSTLDKIG